MLFRSHALRIAVPAALLVVAVVPAVVEVAHSQPYGLSEYNALAGGPAGGAPLGGRAPRPHPPPAE